MSTVQKRLPVPKSEIPPPMAKPKPRLAIVPQLKEDLELYEPASLWARFAALFLDGIFIGVATQALNLLLVLGLGQNNIIASLGGVLVSLLVPPVYFILSMSRYPGQTPGKRLLKIRVVSLEGNGEFSSWQQILKREYLGKFCSAMLMGVGYLIPLVRKDRRALHDFIGHSRVIRYS